MIIHDAQAMLVTTKRAETDNLCPLSFLLLGTGVEEF